MRWPWAFDRLKQHEARLHVLKYVAIEEELERAYRYVTPSSANAKTSSLKFAEIIRSASNAYEVICRTLYARLYGPSENINIFNYLALDVFLNLSTVGVGHLLATDSFAGFPELTQPFSRLTPWDRASAVTKDHIPGWWAAYNTIKHEDTGIEAMATMANATAAVAGLFLVIERIFGIVVLQGGLIALPRQPDDFPALVVRPRWARLFSTDF